MKKFTSGLKIFVFCIFCLLFWSFKGMEVVEETAGFIQSAINKHYDKELYGDKLKRYELNFTNTGFCRYKKYYTNGKVEYFSFNVSRFKDLDYFGTTNNGSLWLRTIDEDVIVQTYNDKGGDVDSMATYVMIPLKEIEAEELNALNNNLMKLKRAVGQKR